MTTTLLLSQWFFIALSEPCESVTIADVRAIALKESPFSPALVLALSQRTDHSGYQKLCFFSFSRNTQMFSDSVISPDGFH